MSNSHDRDNVNSIRRQLAWAALGASAAAPLVRAEQSSSTLQVTYSTDRFMTCDALNEELARMDVIIGSPDAPTGDIKIARERKKRIAAVLQGKKCEPAPAKAYGPDMYDLPGTAAPKR